MNKKNFDPQRDIVYKIVAREKISGHVYLPNEAGLRPAVVVVHGGGWSRRSGDLEPVCRQLAAEGYVVFQPNYRLAPKNQFPLAIEDIRDALKWFREKAFEYSFDPERVAGWGYSAGAHLILMAGLDPSSGLKAIVSGGTPADLTVWPKSRLVLDFMGSALKDRPDLWKEASPMNHVQVHSPHVFLYHGTWDKVVEPEQMEKMKAALLAKNVIVESHRVSNMGHFAVYFFSRESVKLGIQFLNRHLKFAPSSKIEICSKQKMLPSQSRSNPEKI